MTTSIIHLAVGLVLLVAVNIVLGSLNALFDGSFDKVKLRNGIIKGIIVAACFIAFYMAGYLNPDIIAIEVDGQTVNLMTASNLALLTAYVLYAKDVFVKLKNLILSKTSARRRRSPPQSRKPLNKTKAGEGQTSPAFLRYRVMSWPVLPVVPICFLRA